MSVSFRLLALRPFTLYSASLLKSFLLLLPSHTPLGALTFTPTSSRGSATARVSPLGLLLKLMSVVTLLSGGDGVYITLVPYAKVDVENICERDRELPLFHTEYSRKAEGTCTLLFEQTTIVFPVITSSNSGGSDARD